MKSIKMLVTILSLLLVSSIATASVPLAPRAGAGGKMDMYGCMQSNDYYIANFAAYQGQSDSSQSTNGPALLTALCQEIPATGAAQISIDLLDRDVRHKPVIIKVLDSNNKVLLETPSTVAKQGVITANVDFPAPGHYQVVLFVDDDELKIAPEVGALHIPLTVALVTPGASASTSSLAMIVFGILAVALVLGWLMPRLLKPQHA